MSKLIKIMGIILTMYLLMGVVPLTASAAVVEKSGTFGNGLSWELDENGTLTIDGTGAMPDFSDETEMPWYECRESVKMLVIGENITWIGTKAFIDHCNLKSVSFGNNVLVIRWEAFRGCESLETISLSQSLREIGYYAFGGCKSLTSIEIPESVTSIGDYAFYGCESLASIEFPGGVKSIGKRMFYNCKSLISIELPEEVTSRLLNLIPHRKSKFRSG